MPPSRKPKHKPVAAWRRGAAMRTRRLILVESPAKQRALRALLGPRELIKVCPLPLYDLPRTRLGIDVDADFAHEQLAQPGTSRFVAELRALVEDVASVYVAFDPDAAGEAMSLQVARALGDDVGVARLLRLRLGAIDETQLEAALAAPAPIDAALVRAHHAARVAARLVEHRAASIWYDEPRPKPSLHPLEVLACDLLVERERAIEAADADAQATLEVEVVADTAARLRLRLVPKEHGDTASDAQAATDWVAISAQLAGEALEVVAVEREASSWPAPTPFSTVSLLAEAARQLRIPATRTLELARRLYEGLPIDEGVVNLLSHPITSSVGGPALEAWPARAAAVLPTSMAQEPARLRQALERAAAGNREALRESLELLQLYTLVWSRSLASRMAPAELEAQHVEARWGPHRFLATHQSLRSTGHRAVSTERDPPGFQPSLPAVARGQRLPIRAVVQVRAGTPLVRYSEASLLETLVERDLGDAEASARALAALLARGEIERREARLAPTALGEARAARLREALPCVFDRAAAARLSVGLRGIAVGRAEPAAVLRAYHEPLASTAPPTKPAQRARPAPPRRPAPEVDPRAPDPRPVEPCASCGLPMATKRGRYGTFLSCTGYPACRATRPLPLGVDCPRPGCGGALVEKRSRRGNIFYGCANFKKTGCDFVSWDRPVPRACPRCGAPFLVQNDRQLRCLSCALVKQAAPESTRMVKLAQ